MVAPNIVTQPLPPDRSLYMQRAAVQARRVLQHFCGDPVEYGPTALQLLDEWIERLERKGPLPAAARLLVVAFLGQTFLQAHGGYWATQLQGPKQSLGVVCPVAGPGDQTCYINIVDQVNRRLARGIVESLAFYYLTARVDLQGRS